MKYFVCNDGSIDILYNGLFIKIKDDKVYISEINIPVKVTNYEDTCKKAIEYFRKEILHDYAA